MKGKNVGTNSGRVPKGPNPYPKSERPEFVSGMRSDAFAKNDQKNWSIAGQHAKMRAEAHSKGKDHSNLPLQGFPDGGNLKGGK